MAKSQSSRSGVRISHTPSRASRSVSAVSARTRAECFGCDRGALREREFRGFELQGDSSEALQESVV